MGILTADMKRLVNEQQLGFCATVCPDGSPNLSPKGSTRVWDDDRLFFADICSPRTTENLRSGSLIEINVVDPFLRKGYRFKGRAVIYEPASAGFAAGIERMRAGGSALTGRVQAIIVIEVQHAEPLISPAYDDGTTTEADMLHNHRARFAVLHERHGHTQTGPGAPAGP
jgi:predicted pyridoxine 5'-phosphate oxidase superfamily flavin-nucleotide-binding protein